MNREQANQLRKQLQEVKTISQLFELVEKYYNTEAELPLFKQVQIQAFFSTFFNGVPEKETAAAKD